MGESINSATIIAWSKQVGDYIKEDEVICEVSTDKVDNEVPATVSGTIKEILFQPDDEVKVGDVLARIEVGGNGTVSQNQSNAYDEKERTEQTASAKSEAKPVHRASGAGPLSPMMRALAQRENISDEELSQIPGSGAHGRITKRDFQEYMANRSASPVIPQENVEIIEMDRMRRMIADHMVKSKQTSPHVTAYVEVDMTDVVNWRNRVKADFQARHCEKLTFTPLFVEAVAKAIKEFPGVNASVSGKYILLKKDINIGIATALPSGNLIVPVIKNADQKDLVQLAKETNELVEKARTDSLKPDDIQDGTFTISNVGTFRNVMGTPIINQPQAAILATGMIRKKPAVVESPVGDLIKVRQMMYLSLSFDHRIVDGHLGGSFLAKIGDYLREVDVRRTE